MVHPALNLHWLPQGECVQPSQLPVLVIMYGCMQSVLLLVLAVCVVRSQLVFPLNCPNQAVVQNFDSTQYLGLWYENQKYPVIFETGGKCITATYSDNGNNKIGVLNSQRNILTNKVTTITGEAKFTGSTSEASLTVSFQGIPFGDGSYNVLDTDYTSYAIVWSCQDLLLFNTQILWILTREQNPSSTLIDNVRQIIENRGITLLFLKPTDQTNC
ncbi:hypothetical protein Pcinc_024303 [Petrolisthes cinctipes]|uniref:Apolipoprotein D n=1 Tax=Petrolisthes cinctipes TaxID=88211 RepID=A0AAE1FAN8_PETCI|nr:hypothetical protein Pcinc_024303 [Petrolisthes cinctipes]